MALAVALGLSACTAAVNRSADAGAPAADDASPPTDAGIPPLNDAGVAACDHYFDAQYLRCGGPTLPPNETARIRVRFHDVCRNEVALPGSSVTPATLEACASALDISSCEFPVGHPVECAFAGSRPSGAACTDGLQCQSGSCRGTANYTPAGQSGPFTCGTCLPLAAVGDVCNAPDASAGCGSHGICLAPTSNGDQACEAIALGDVGAACDNLAASCKTGLYCAASTGKCTSLAEAGAPCGVGQNWPGGCIAPLACTGVCGSGAVGAHCTNDVDCAPGLGCASGACTAITWLGPGQPCGDTRRCLVGACGVSTAADGGVTLTCPAVVPDGQPCTIGFGVPGSLEVPTCDTFAQCFAPVDMPGVQGTCTVVDGFTCR